MRKYAFLALVLMFSVFAGQNAQAQGVRVGKKADFVLHAELKHMDVLLKEQKQLQKKLAESLKDNDNDSPAIGWKLIALSRKVDRQYQAIWSLTYAGNPNYKDREWNKKFRASVKRWRRADSQTLSDLPSEVRAFLARLQSPPRYKPGTLVSANSTVWFISGERDRRAYTSSGGTMHSWGFSFENVIAPDTVKKENKGRPWPKKVLKKLFGWL
jgi:hypothetical protein